MENDVNIFTYALTMSQFKPLYPPRVVFRFTLTHPPANKQKLGFPEKIILAVQKNLSSFWCNKTQDNSLVLLASKLVPLTDSMIS